MKAGVRRFLVHSVEQLPSRWFTAVFALGVGGALTALAYQAVRKSETERVRDQFTAAAFDRTTAVRKTLDLNLEVLRSIESFFGASRIVESEDFAAFAGSALARHRAIAALRWAPHVEGAARTAHEQAVRTKGVAGYTITEGDRAGRRVPAGKREEYFPILFQVSAEPDTGALGLDLAATPAYRELIAKSRDIGVPVAVASEPAAPAPDSPPRVTVFLPVFHRGVPRGAAEGGPPRLMGFVVAVYHIPRLLDDALSRFAAGAVRLELYGGSEPGTGRLLCSYPPVSSGAPVRGAAAGLELAVPMDVAGRRWLLHCTPGAEIGAWGPAWLPGSVLIGGLLFTLALTAYVVTLVGRAKHVERLVAERTEELAGANRNLADEVEQRGRAEAVLRERTVELARSNAELEQFAYAASHDLQEPLRMISSFVQLLSERAGEKLTPEEREFIGFAADGARRMQKLIHDLLGYSRLGRAAGEPAPVSCEAALGQVLLNLQTAIAEANAVVTHDPLPTPTADESQLIQLLQNLISNGIKFRRTEPPRVHVSAVRQGVEWLFSVRDNGIGVEAQYADRLFRIFQRLHTRDEYPGTGIGLAMCKKIVEHHRGRIWVESVPGQGSTFYFTLPTTTGDH